MTKPQAIDLTHLRLQTGLAKLEYCNTHQMPREMNQPTLSRLISGQATRSDLGSITPPEWETLVTHAQAEGIAPILYWQLSSDGLLASLPVPEQKSLRAAYYSVRMNNEQIIQEMENLTRLFEKAGIPIVVLKGACLALTVYPDIGLRPMADLDLLVPARKLTKATRIAKMLGYSEVIPEALPGLRGLLGEEVCLQKTGMPFIALELHNSLLVDQSYTYAVRTDWFWEQTEPMSGTSLKAESGSPSMLSPTAQVLHLAAHAMLKHGGRNTTLRWYYDLDLLIRAYLDRIDWDLLLKKSWDFQWGSALDAALEQTRELFDTPIPDHVLEELATKADRNRNLVALKQYEPSTRVFEEYQNLKGMKWYGRVLLALRLIVPGPAYMRWRYGLRNNRSLPATYLFRWRSILQEVFQTVIQILRRGRSMDQFS